MSVRVCTFIGPGLSVEGEDAERQRQDDYQTPRTGHNTGHLEGEGESERERERERERDGG